MSTIAKAPKLGKKKELRLWTFLLGLATASAFFIPFIINGEGYFIFFGDFNVQQIPFYQHCHEMVRSGDFFGWDWQTDLGANFIGSYSFYLLGSPFFWLTLPFPTSFVPYLMGPLLILKFACASLTAYLFIRRFTARPESAMLGGLLYAFSGFSVYNIFFNHFHEAIVVFPLLLLAMEKFMAERTRGLLILAVFLATLTNYFFFFGMVVFVIIYWSVRMLSKSFKFNIVEFLLMMFECVLGLTLAAAVLLPTVLEVIQNERLGSLMNGWGAVMYGKEQIFLNVIECFFFPPDLPARPVFFPGAEVKWSSLGGWLPLFGMTGVIAWLQAKKKGTWQRRVLAICIVMALIPGLNAVFSLLNTAYYARWFFMPILLMSLVTAVSLEDTEVDWSSSWRWSAGITAAFVLVIGFMPTLNDAGAITKWGLYTDASTNPIRWIYQTFCRAVDGVTEVNEFNTFDTRFWVTASIALLSVVAMRALIPIIKEKRKNMFTPIIGLVCLISVIYPYYFVYCGQEHSYNRHEVMDDALIEGKLSISEEKEFFRVDVYDGVDNTGLYLDVSSINFFHSVVPASVTEFYEYVGVPRSVASRPEAKFSALRPFLSVKYLIDPNIENSKEFVDEYGNTEMPNYTFYGTENEKTDDDGNGIIESRYDIYLNQNYIPMGFTYDYYMDEKTMGTQLENRRIHMMLKALLVEEKDIPKISQYLTNMKNEYMVGENYTGIRPLSFDNQALQKDCEARKTVSAHYFKTSSDGFTAQISMDRANLVFFSVPYHEGWTAKVNGVDAEIFRVNKGFMAVVAPEGLCEIVFEYETPGLTIGIVMSLITLIIAAIYVGGVAIKRSVKPVPPPEYPEGEVISAHIERYEAAVYAAENPEDDYLLDDIDHSKIDAYVGFDNGFTIDDSALEEFQTGSLTVDTVENAEDDALLNEALEKAFSTEQTEEVESSEVEPIEQSAETEDETVSEAKTDSIADNTDDTDGDTNLTVDTATAVDSDTSVDSATDNGEQPDPEKKES